MVDCEFGSDVWVSRLATENYFEIGMHVEEIFVVFNENSVRSLGYFAV